jgi:hypothetical protein
MIKKILNLGLIFAFVVSSTTIPQIVYAAPLLGLPEPGNMVSLSAPFQPAIIKGLTVNKSNPFQFDFIVDVGQDKLSGDALKAEGDKLIKYFLASLAIPEKDWWVNLSPYEKDKTVPEALGQTDLGRDLLAQDYILKQITASLIYPEKELGKTFWDKIYAKSRERFGNVQIPVNTFNKVWITADKAEVFEHNQSAFVTKSHLKVMLEEDYLATQKNTATSMIKKDGGAASQVVREVILPELEREINEGKNFANLRQIYNSLILASWYKNNLKEALLNQVYTGKSTVKGIDIEDKNIKQQIYDRYLLAYKKGVFNFIKEDEVNNQVIPRKYFSGGMDAGMAANPTMTRDATMLILPTDRLVNFNVGANANIDPRVKKTETKDLAQTTQVPIMSAVLQYLRVLVDTIKDIEGKERFDELMDKLVSADNFSNEETSAAFLEVVGIVEQYLPIKDSLDADKWRNANMILMLMSNFPNEILRLNGNEYITDSEVRRLIPEWTAERYAEVSKQIIETFLPPGTFYRKPDQHLTPVTYGYKTATGEFDENEPYVSEMVATDTIPKTPDDYDRRLTKQISLLRIFIQDSNNGKFMIPSPNDTPRDKKTKELYLYIATDLGLLNPPDSAMTTKMSFSDRLHEQLINVFAHLRERSDESVLFEALGMDGVDSTFDNFFVEHWEKEGIRDQIDHEKGRSIPTRHNYIQLYTAYNLIIKSFPQTDYEDPAYVNYVKWKYLDFLVLSVKGGFLRTGKGSRGTYAPKYALPIFIKEELAVEGSEIRSYFDNEMKNNKNSMVDDKMIDLFIKHLLIIPSPSHAFKISRQQTASQDHAMLSGSVDSEVLPISYVENKDNINLVIDAWMSGVDRKFDLGKEYYRKAIAEAKEEDVVLLYSGEQAKPNGVLLAFWELNKWHIHIVEATQGEGKRVGQRMVQAFIEQYGNDMIQIDPMFFGSNSQGAMNWRNALKMLGFKGSSSDFSLMRQADSAMQSDDFQIHNYRLSRLGFEGLVLSARKLEHDVKVQSQDIESFDDLIKYHKELFDNLARMDDEQKRFAEFRNIASGLIYAYEVTRRLIKKSRDEAFFEDFNWFARINEIRDAYLDDLRKLRDARIEIKNKLQIRLGFEQHLLEMISNTKVSLESRGKQWAIKQVMTFIANLNEQFKRLSRYAQDNKGAKVFYLTDIFNFKDNSFEKDYKEVKTLGEYLVSLSEKMSAKTDLERIMEPFMQYLSTQEKTLDISKDLLLDYNQANELKVLLFGYLITIEEEMINKIEEAAAPLVNGDRGFLLEALKSEVEFLKTIIGVQFQDAYLSKDQKIYMENLLGRVSKLTWHHPSLDGIKLDPAMKATGGIDLKRTQENIAIKKDDGYTGVQMDIDPQLIEAVKREGIQSLTPVIFSITPIANIWQTIGIAPPKMASASNWQ